MTSDYYERWRAIQEKDRIYQTAAAHGSHAGRTRAYRALLRALDDFLDPTRDVERRAIVAAGGAPIAYVPPIAQTTKAANESPPRHAFREETPIMQTDSTINTAVINSVTVECDLLLSQLEVAPEYQRPIRLSWVLKLVREFDPALVGKIRVAERDDHFYVVDGQHRLEALKRIFAGEDRRVRCDVQMLESVEDQARLFVMLSTARVPLSSFDVFRARLAANDPYAHGIVDALGRYGYEIAFSHGTETAGRCAAFGALDRLYGTPSAAISQRGTSGRDGGVGGGSPERFDRVLGVLFDAYGNDIVLTSSVMYAVDSFLLRYAAHPNYKRSRLVETLRAMDVDRGPEVGRLATEMQVTRRKAAPIAMLHKYNGRLAMVRRLPTRFGSDDAADDEAA